MENGKTGILKDDTPENTWHCLVSIILEDMYFFIIGTFPITYGASQKYTIPC